MSLGPCPACGREQLDYSWFNLYRAPLCTDCKRKAEPLQDDEEGKENTSPHGD